jgi:hypothetical protein
LVRRHGRRGGSWQDHRDRRRRRGRPLGGPGRQAARRGAHHRVQPHFDTDGTPNIARFIFLDRRAQDYYADWALARRTAAAIMRLEAGRDPLNKDLTALIGKLSTRSPQFREDWSGHDVHEHRTGVKSFQHPVVGRVTVAFDVFAMPGEAGLQIVTYSPPPNTDSAEKFALLASWAATQEAERAPDGGLVSRSHDGVSQPASTD